MTEDRRDYLCACILDMANMAHGCINRLCLSDDREELFKTRAMLISYVDSIYSDHIALLSDK